MATAEEMKAMRYLRADGFFSPDDKDRLPVYLVDFGKPQILNLNDFLYPATADYEAVKPEDAPELAALIRRYGTYGMAYWVFQRRGLKKCAFESINRMVEVITAEEHIRGQCVRESQ